MKLINPSFEIWEQEPGLEGIYKHIERAARVCYKSESNIKEGSAKKMVDALIKNKHLAMLEHGTVYLRVKGNESISSKYQHNQYSRVKLKYSDDPNTPNIYDIPTHYITTNMRVLVENGWLDDLKYLCEPTEHHEKRVTIKFITSIGITRELIRHRKFSFANESTRYCNYSSDKFSNEITIVTPSWVKPYTYDTYDDMDDAPIETILFDSMCHRAESTYFELLRLGLKPQQARDMLPLATKSELIMTGFIEDWRHFFFLRADDGTGPAHPDMKAIAVPLKEEFIKRNLI